jgi:hypothetical protein
VSATRVAPTCREPPDLAPANVAQKVASALAAPPINAMLNYCYSSRLGGSPRCSRPRPGLADRLPSQRQDGPQRACVGPIDAKVFAFAAEHEFARLDFPQSGYNAHRLSRDVTQLLLHFASLPSRDIDDETDWMVRSIVRCVRVKQAK